MPDSFSRTMPLWAAALNRAVARLRIARSCNPSPAVAWWDTALYTPTSVIPQDEASAMAAVVDARVDALLASGAPLDSVAAQLTRPLRCCWAWRRADGSIAMEGNAGALHSAGYAPIVCFCVTRPVDEEQQEDYVYLQVCPTQSQGVMLQPKAKGVMLVCILLWVSIRLQYGVGALVKLLRVSAVH